MPNTDSVQMTTLKRSGLRVSRVCFGTMTFGSQVEERTAGRMIDFCFERGINFLDTANVYNKGASEEILGRLLKGRRHDVVLASKVGIKAGADPLEAGLARGMILRAAERSLARLQTDYLDLYYMHAPDYSVPFEESLEAMDLLVRQGKVRHVAVSNHASWQVCRLLWLAERNGYTPVTVTQPMYNLLARGLEQEFLPMCKEFGLATAVYNPLAGGLLTGKHTGGEPSAGTRFDGNKMYQDRYWHGPNFDAVGRLAELAGQAGRSLVSLALNWLLHHTPADCIILGASRIEQLEENVNALADGPLPAEVVEQCDGVWRQVRGVVAQYNR